MDLLACWKGGSGLVLLTYGGQFYYASFDYLERLFGIECSPSELKLFLLRSVYDWMVALSGHSFSTLEEFLDLCSFR